MNEFYCMMTYSQLNQVGIMIYDFSKNDDIHVARYELSNWQMRRHPGFACGGQKESVNNANRTTMLCLLNLDFQLLVFFFL